jgi:sugar transferase (PEP-CTERM system associated)
MRTLRVLGHRVSLPLVLLSLVEAGAVAGAAYAGIAHDAFGESNGGTPLSISAFAGVALMILMSALGLYQLNLRTSFTGIVARTAIAFLVAVPVAGVLYLLLPQRAPSIEAVITSAFAAFVMVSVLHALFFAGADAGLFKRRVLVLGGGNGLHALQSLRRKADRRGFEIVGYLATDDEALPGPRLHWNRPLAELALDAGADEIVVSMAERRNRMPIAALMDCRYSGIGVVEMIDFIEREAGKVRIDLLRPGWMLFNANEQGRFGAVAKRTLDLTAAALLLALGWPLMLATVAAIKIEDGGRAPVLYRQRRVGRGGAVFEVLKFRSMRTDAEADGRPRFASVMDSRVTRVGRIIRKLRIDELPQVFNVIRGDMSLVGPRPERPEFVAELEKDVPFYRERHRIKPGITGWAQLLYPYGASREDMIEKLQYDLYYLKNRSLLLDVVILLHTVEVVLFGKGSR